MTCKFDYLDKTGKCFEPSVLGCKECIGEACPGWVPEYCTKDPQSGYYDQGGLEVLDIIKAKLPPEQYRGFLLGNVIKYSTRLNWKHDISRDAEKLADYSIWLNEEIGGK